MFNLFKKNKKTFLRQKELPNNELADVKDVREVNTPELSVERTPENRNSAFSDHIGKYIGSTVTVFLRAGGICGSGFTGILISSNSNYIRLLIRIGPPPACSLFNSCSKRINSFPLHSPFSNYLYWNYSIPIFSFGSIACIPVNKIAAFVHNVI